MTVVDCIHVTVIITKPVVDEKSQSCYQLNPFSRIWSGLLKDLTNGWFNGVLNPNFRPFSFELRKK